MVRRFLLAIISPFATCFIHFLTYFLLAGRLKPIAPTCNVCLVRNDQTTVWCEVTFSLRTREPDEDSKDDSSVKGVGSKTTKSNSDKPTSTDDVQSLETRTDREVVTAGCKEILLCLRPIRDGEKKTVSKFVTAVKKNNRVVSEDSKSALSSSEDSGGMNQTNSTPSNPKEKHAREPNDDERDRKKARTSQVDRDVVDSLMAMSATQQI